MNKPGLVFWRETPVDVEYGLYEYITEHWGNSITIISMHGMSSERKLCSWDKNTIQNSELINFDNIENRSKEAKSLIEKNIKAIHIFCGFRGEKQNYLNYYLSTVEKPKLAFICERPTGFSGSLPKRIMTRIMYNYYALKYEKYLSCFLAMGKKGTQDFKKYGWSSEVLYPFMYCPKLPKVSYLQKDRMDKIKFLYIGRFDEKYKGVDMLIHAVDMLNEDDSWSLDLIGGYGSIAEKVINWADKKKNVKFCGAWLNETVCEKMQDYDICLVPSKYDGWNITPNQAIHSGIATIITDQAVSDELIRKSGAGIVIPSNDATALYQAMLNAIKNPDTIEIWKEKAMTYSNKISIDVVGKYFIDIMEYCYCLKQNLIKPTCPWL